MKFTKLPLAACAVGLTLGLGGLALAQEQAPPPAGQHSGADREAMKQRHEARRAEHARTLHDALAIRSDQEAAFQAFLASSEHKRGPGGLEGRRDGDKGEHAALTTPERLDRMAERMHRRQEMFEHHAEAVKRFYAALSPEQQRTFDALGRMGGGGHGRGGRGPGGHEHGGHEHGGPEGHGGHEGQNADEG